MSQSLTCRNVSESADSLALFSIDRVCTCFKRDYGDSEEVGRHERMFDLYRSVHGPSSTSVWTQVLFQVHRRVEQEQTGLSTVQETVHSAAADAQHRSRRSYGKLHRFQVLADQNETKRSRGFSYTLAISGRLEIPATFSLNNTCGQRRNVRMWL